MFRDEVEKGPGLRAFEGDGFVAAVAKGAEQVEGGLPHGYSGEGFQAGCDSGAVVGHF